jgi:hypothetical protein
MLFQSWVDLLLLRLGSDPFQEEGWLRAKISGGLLDDAYKGMDCAVVNTIH